MVIKVENLVKRYKELIALNGFDFEVKEKEIVGLLGPNGSGKTTAINCMLAILAYSEGKITIFDQEMKPTAYEIKKRIGLVMQEVGVMDGLNVYENIDYFCSLYILDKKLRRQYVQEAMDFVGISDYAKFTPNKLSGGLLRRLNIACGIAHKPSLIFLDEPTVAVDPQSRNNILAGIKKLNREGATIVYTSHYMEEVEYLCDKIYILDKGRVIAKGSKDELKQLVSTNEKIIFEVYDVSEEQIAKIGKITNVIDVEYKETLLTIKCQKAKHNLVNILKVINDEQLTFERIISEQPTLNDVFLELTGKELRD